MRTIVLLVLTMTACGASADATDRTEVPADAAGDARSDAYDAGAALCCQTAAHGLLTCDPFAPWACGPDDASAPPTCRSGGCTAGETCRGLFTGPGVVVACDR